MRQTSAVYRAADVYKCLVAYVVQSRRCCRRRGDDLTTVGSEVVVYMHETTIDVIRRRSSVGVHAH